MQRDKNSGAGSDKSRGGRAERLDAELRANLRRRKDQARARGGEQARVTSGGEAAGNRCEDE